MRNIVLVFALAVTGCFTEMTDERAPPAADPDPAMPDVETAREVFVANVYPTLAAKCAGGGCHDVQPEQSTPMRFIGPDADSTYELLRPDPQTGEQSLADALLRLKSHYGTLFTAAERAAIEHWLDLETP